MRKNTIKMLKIGQIWKHKKLNDCYLILYQKYNLFFALNTTCKIVSFANTSEKDERIINTYFRLI